MEFKCPMEVRDYELDAQGIVNNSVYFNYMEHARHQLLRERGIDFVELHRDGVDPVVVNATIDFKSPLRSGERFEVRTSVRKKGMIRYQFHQEIWTAGPDMRLCCSGVITAVVLVHGNPSPHPLMELVLEDGANK